MKIKPHRKMSKLISGVVSASLIITTFSGISFTQPQNVSAETESHTLQNPRIVADDSMEAGQKVTYDCVWFGSYPQAEVVPASKEYTALSEDLLQEGDLIRNDALYSALQNATYWNEFGDTEIDGERYRRVKSEDATYTSSSSNYYNWENKTTFHYFKYQPIKWRVLQVNGSEAFLLADKALDDRKYHVKSENVTWEGSTIRSWLNGYGYDENIANTSYLKENFIDTAFDVSEQDMIKESYVENKDNLNYGTEGGNDTTDKIFLLSESEVYTDEANKYGFVSNYNTYDEARRSKSSSYAKAMGTWSSTSSSYVGNCDYWLRSPGLSSYDATFVYSDGWVHRYSNYVSHDDLGVRPALNLNLNASSDASSSNLYSYAGTVCSDGTVDEVGGGSIAGDGINVNGCLSLDKVCNITEQEVRYVWGKASADSYYKLKEIGDSLVWSSADNSIATVEGCGYIMPSYTDVGNMSMYAKVTGIAEGETDIYVTASDGSKVTCHVTVDSKNGTSTGKTGFNEYIYRANQLFSNAYPEGQALDDYINMGTPTEAMVKELQNNGYDGITMAWKMVTSVCDTILDASKVVDMQLEEKDIYSAIILNVMESAVTYSLVDTINLNIIKDSTKLFSTIKKDLKLKYSMEIDASMKNSELTEEMRKRTKELAGEYFESKKMAKAVKWLEKFQNVMGYVSTVEDFCEEIASYINLRNMNDSMKEVLKEMKKNCPNSNMALKAALNDCINILDTSDEKFDIQMVAGGLKLVGTEASKVVISKLWSEVVISTIEEMCPEVAIIKAVYKTTKYFTNLVFNTDSLVEKYYKMLAIKEFNSLTRNTYSSLKNKYKNDKNVDNAKNYLSAIDVFFNVLEADCKSAYAYVDELDSTNMVKICAIFDQHDNSSLKTSIENIQKSFYLEYETTLTSWLSYLELDYPEEYPNYANILAESEKRIKEYKVHCPVDVYIYDSNDTLVASVVDDIPTTSGLTIFVKNDEKTIYIPEGEEYTFKYIGNDTGSMDINITEYDFDRSILRNVYFNDLSLTDGLTYVSSDNGKILENEEYIISDESKGDIESNLDTFLSEEKQKYNIKINQGTIYKSGDPNYNMTAYAGEVLNISAFVPKGYEFDKWKIVSGNAKIDNDKSVSTKLTVEDSDVSVIAEFKKVNQDGDDNQKPDTSSEPSSKPNITSKPTTSPTINPTTNPSPTPTSPLASYDVSGSGGGSSTGNGSSSGSSNNSSQTTAPQASPTSSVKPTATPQVSSTPKPTTSVPDATPKASSTPKPTTVSTSAPNSGIDNKPSNTAKPNNNNTTASSNNKNGKSKLKKGSKVTDKKTKAVYKITKKGKVKTVQYTKSTKKNKSNITIPDKVKLNGKSYKVTSIGKSAFKNNTKLKKVKIGKNIKTIGKDAFSGCKNLTDLKMGENITNIKANAFSKCTSLTIITIPSKVNKIGNRAFYQCKNLRYVLVKSNKLLENNVGEEVFSGGYSTPRIKTDKSKWKLYQKIFTSRGMSPRALYVIDPVKLVI